MKLLQLSDLKLSRIMLGTVQFGLPYGIANRSGQPSYETVHSIIAAAYEGGVNCFDTAAGYGTSEEVVGQVLAELRVADKVTVVTKAVRVIDELLSEKAAEKIITETALRSLQRLRLEVLPVYLFHTEEHFRHIGILLKLKEKGLIRHVGVSVMTPEANGGFVCGILNHNPVVAGGTNWREGKKYWLDQIWQYNVKQNEWLIKGTLPKPIGYAEFDYDSSGQEKQA